MVEVFVRRIEDLPAPSTALSQDERERAGLFAVARDRDRFIATRGFLRRVLAERIGKRPEELQFRYGEQGKPCTDGIKFNVSHSGDLVAIAIHPSREIGIDIEKVRPFEWEAVAKRFFSISEREGTEIVEDFFTIWCRKEAYAKALGVGLSDGIGLIDIESEYCRNNWSIKDVYISKGYVGALCLQGSEAESVSMS